MVSKSAKIEKKKRYFFSGVEVARGRVSYPELSEYAEIEKFYAELSENAFKWFCEIFCKQVEEEYRRNFENKNMAAFRRYDYVLEISIKGESMYELLIECNATLGRRGEENISDFCEYDKWDKKDQIILKK